VIYRLASSWGVSGGVARGLAFAGEFEEGATAPLFLLSFVFMELRI
jgi:hypothetical protein